MAKPDYQALFRAEWQRQYDETAQRQPSFPPQDYYTSGRASKAWPNKEDPTWWDERGPGFVESWTNWREQSGLKVAEVLNFETGEVVPAIELECWAEADFDYRTHSVRSIIDRVMVDEHGSRYIVDLKTGSHTPAWPMQLALNNLGLRARWDINARWGGFWNARKGGVEKWFDLSVYTDDLLWDWVRKAYQIRDNQLFIPQPTNLCNSACGVKQYCRAVGGDPSSFENHATIAQKENK